MQFAKIINQFGKSFTIPLFRAKTMQLNGEIKYFEIIEVEHAINADKPKTQAEWERSI